MGLMTAHLDRSKSIKEILNIISRTYFLKNREKYIQIKVTIIPLPIGPV
jgi:hypothetical protein